MFILPRPCFVTHHFVFVLFQFSSKWYLCAQKSPYALHPVSQKFPQRCLWNGSSVRLIDDGPLSSFQGRSSSASSFHVLGFVAAVSVPSFSTLQVFGEASHFWGLLFPASLSARSFPLTPACPGLYTHWSFRRWISTIETFQPGFPIPPFVASSLNLWGWWHVWSVTSWGNPAEGMSDCFLLYIYI